MEAKPKAAVIIVDDGRVLLVEENSPDVRGKLNWVQGAIEVGESAEDAVRREAREETNLDLAGLQLLEDIDVPEQPDSTDITVFVGTISTGTPARQHHEIRSLKWLTLKEIQTQKDRLVGPWVLRGIELAIRSRASRGSA